MEYTTVNNILSKFHRDLRGTDINESDAIEWIGEALEFLKVPQIQEQSVTFLEVKDYQAVVPKGLHAVLQIARNNDWVSENNAIEDVELVVEDYYQWISCDLYKEKYTPVRLANHVFFQSLVCKEKTPYIQYGEDEYTIAGVADKVFRFSFEEGQIALAYIKNALDEDTGYPLIPDNISYITAITYYIKWKIAERLSWSGREGAARLAQDSERLWLKYARQGKNYMKMPKSLDDFQDLLEQSHHLIPRHRKYYGFFGNLGREEYRGFTDPDRNRSMDNRRDINIR